MVRDDEIARLLVESDLDPYQGNIRLVQLSDGKDTKVIDLKPFAEKGDLRTLPELAPLRKLLAAPKPGGGGQPTSQRTGDGCLPSVTRSTS